MRQAMKTRMFWYLVSWAVWGILFLIGIPGAFFAWLIITAMVLFYLTDRP